MTILKLGTRQSLLARTQSTWVADQLMKIHPGLKIELVGIETQGDRITEIPLSQMEGKEFFVKELDEALLFGKIDFAVHSLKDLSLERPTGIHLAAIPKREDPRDIALFNSSIFEKCKAGLPIYIGTSSPRRLENTSLFLKQALPQFKHSLNLRFVEIRGNVNTRLSRLREPSDSKKYLDGVILALAGLNRLRQGPFSKDEIEVLLAGHHTMILPLTHSPSAAGQGALAVECREDDSNAKKIISKLHHPDTASWIKREREILADWGGGCHQRFGATCLQHSELGELLFLKGKKPDGSDVDEIRWQTPKSLHKPMALWNGMEWKADFFPGKNSEISKLRELPDRSLIFIAHARALPKNLEEEVLDKLNHCRIWTSGPKSWFALAKRGLWVEGCAENLGFEHLQQTPSLANVQWLVLTHKEAETTWPGQSVLTTYRIDDNPNPVAIQGLKEADHVFWSSPSQFKTYGSFAQKNAIHACGPGKTARFLKQSGVSPLFVFPSAKEWKKWLN